jgi:hypothetical protein
MAANRTNRRWMIVVCLWSLAGLLVLGLTLSLVCAYFGSLAFASYPGTVEFMGHSRLFGTTYFAVKWLHDPAAPGSCSLVIHLPTGDVGEKELAEAGGLLKLGWKEVPYPPMPAEAAALLGPDRDQGLPQVVKFGYGDLRVATQHNGGELTSVWVWLVEPGHETMAWSAGASRYSISINGKRIPLPLPEAEMVRVLGVPEGRRKDY